MKLTCSDYAGFQAVVTELGAPAAADTGTLTVAAAVTNAVVANAIDASASIVQCIFGD